MAFLVPPCPRCSGVLRLLDFDAARCRCGFEVDGFSQERIDQLKATMLATKPVAPDGERRARAPWRPHS